MRERGLAVSYVLDDYDEWSVAVKLLEQRFHISDEERLAAIEEGEEDKFSKKKIIYFEESWIRCEYNSIYLL